MIGRSALYYEDYVLSIQYFNQAIAAKPYLYEPWFFRAVAKYYLDDFAGAEADCTEAIDRNPYIVNLYELRGLTRIQQKKYKDAIGDYTKALKYDPEGQNLWHNRILCRIQEKDYDKAHLELDTMLTRWSQYARGYSMRAEIYMMQKDTTSAVEALERSLELDPYDGAIWAERAVISLSRSEWKESEEYLSKAIHLLPKQANNYINRALARYNQNNLRGAMADYDVALDFDPNNFLGHYNRGLLRAQVGDDNRAILDFDFVLTLEPENLMALYNRATLLHRTGDLRGAIRDYSKVIDQYPNFWIGLQNRADCYRRLGMKNQAELDEFRIFKAQMDKHVGIQPRWTKNQARLTRKKSEVDMSKYNQIVVADEETVEHEYESAYRGKVQNRRLEIDYMPMYVLSYMPYLNVVKAYQVFDRSLDAFNQQARPRHTVYLTCNPKTLEEKQANVVFSLADSLSADIQASTDLSLAKDLLLQRAVTALMTQNFTGAAEDLTTCIGIDDQMVLAYWMRAVCVAMENEFSASQGMDSQLKNAGALADFDKALQLDPDNAYILYDRGNLHMARSEYMLAIDDYTRGIAVNPQLAEAWFNRGLAYIHSGKKEEGLRDLSHAGELGLFGAYSMMKKFAK